MGGRIVEEEDVVEVEVGEGRLFVWEVELYVDEFVVEVRVCGMDGFVEGDGVGYGEEGEEDDEE